MKKTAFGLKVNKWLTLAEIALSPTKRIQGKWQLYEYYFEPEDELINIKQEELSDTSQFWEIEFFDNKYFNHSSNITIPLVWNLNNGTWSILKNYITLIDPKNFRNNIEFQFAFNKGNLKLLKKDRLGKIVFFGFFKRSTTASD